MVKLLKHISETVEPSDEDVRLALESLPAFKRLAEMKRKKPVRVRVPPNKKSEKIIVIPAIAVRLLGKILVQIAKGNAITLMPVHAELTTQQAADLIGVSRPFLVQRLEKNEIPFHRVGAHRRVRYKDLMAYKNRMDAARHEALDELTAQAQELGLGY